MIYAKLTQQRACRTQVSTFMRDFVTIKLSLHASSTRSSRACIIRALLTCIMEQTSNYIDDMQKFEFGSTNRKCLYD